MYFHDFDLQYFGQGWDQWYKDSVVGKHGHVIVFPLKAKLQLTRAPPNGFFKNSDGEFIPKPRPYTETLRIEIIKDNR